MEEKMNVRKETLSVYSGENGFGKPNQVTAIATTIATSFKLTLDDLAPIVEDFICQTEARLRECEIEKRFNLPFFHWGQYAALRESGAIAIQVALCCIESTQPYWFAGTRPPILGRVKVRPHKVVVEHYRHSDLSSIALSLAGAPISELIGRVAWRMPREIGEKAPIMPKETSDEIYDELSGDKFINGLIDFIRTETENDEATPTESTTMQAQGAMPTASQSDTQPTANQVDEEQTGSKARNLLGQKRIFGLRVGYLIAFIFLVAVSVLVSWVLFPGWSLLVLIASAVVGVTAFLANFRKISE